MIVPYIDCGKVITSSKGKFTVVESNGFISDVYLLIDLNRGDVVDSSMNINNFREHMGEIFRIQL